MMKRSVFVAMLASGCAGDPTAIDASAAVDAPRADGPPVDCFAGDSCDQTVTVAGDPVAPDRVYRLTVPTGYTPGTPVPLVLVLHGYGSSGMAMEGITGFDAKADAETFIVVYPDGATTATLGPTWNDGITPSTSG